MLVPCLDETNEVVLLAVLSIPKVHNHSLWTGGRAGATSVTYKVLLAVVKPAAVGVVAVYACVVKPSAKMIALGHATSLNGLLAFLSFGYILKVFGTLIFIGFLVIILLLIFVGLFLLVMLAVSLVTMFITVFLVLLMVLIVSLVLSILAVANMLFRGRHGHFVSVFALLTVLSSVLFSPALTVITTISISTISIVSFFSLVSTILSGTILSLILIPVVARGLLVLQLLSFV